MLRGAAKTLYALPPIQTINAVIFGGGARRFLSGYNCRESHCRGASTMISPHSFVKIAYPACKARNSAQCSCWPGSLRITSLHPDNKIME